MQVRASIGPDGGRRRTAVIATAMVHVAFLALLLWGAPRPSTSPTERPALILFDLPRPPDPPPVPITPPPVSAQPVKRESAVLRPTAGGGSPRPTRAPMAEQAAPAAAAPARFDRVDRPAPAAEFSTDLPLRAGTAASDGRGVGIASGRGTGGEGQGTGKGRGDGDGPGEGRLRFALAEWIEKPPQGPDRRGLSRKGEKRRGQRGGDPALLRPDARPTQKLFDRRRTAKRKRFRSGGAGTLPEIPHPPGDEGR